MNDKREPRSEQELEKLDRDILAIGRKLFQMLEAENGSVHMINPTRLKEMNDSYRMIKGITKDCEGIKIETGQDDKLVSMGYMSVVGRELRFSDGIQLAKALSLADVVEFTSFLNGETEIMLTFYGLTKKIS